MTHVVLDKALECPSPQAELCLSHATMHRLAVDEKGLVFQSDSKLGETGRLVDVGVL